MNFTLTTSIKHNMSLAGIKVWLTAFLNSIQSKLPDTGNDSFFEHNLYFVLASKESLDIEILPNNDTTISQQALCELLNAQTNSKPPANPISAAFFRLARSQGWTLSTRGWPDYFMVKDGQIALINVTEHRGRKLRKHQKAILLALASYGVPCYRYSPESGYERIGLKEIPVKETSP